MIGVLKVQQEGNKLQRQKILSFIYPIYNHNWSNIYIHIYMYVYVCIYIYIYIHTQRGAKVGIKFYSTNYSDRRF